MSKKKEDKKLTKDQAVKKITTLKKDLFNIRFKKINNQINTKPTINKYNKNYFKTRVKKTSYRLKIAV